MVDALLLKTTYPCCGKRARFVAILGVPRERYDRVCAACDTRWTITRSLAGERGGVRVDGLEWVDGGPA